MSEAMLPPRCCGTCRRLIISRGTYGLCRPRDVTAAGSLPWWMTAFIAKAQTHVRPDEGVGCPAWEAKG